MDAGTPRDYRGQATEETLTQMSAGQFAMILDDISVVESLIPKEDHGLTLEALFNRVYLEAGKRSIGGYEHYADKSDSPLKHAEKRLLDSGLTFNKRGEVVPIFPPKA
ncbi:MAG: hypothetical protein ABI700_14130 [Chloroflexota bacterium]